MKTNEKTNTKIDFLSMKKFKQFQEKHIYRDIKNAFIEATGCDIQHNGWTCGSCFFAIDSKLNNKDWQTILLYRGDYKKKDLDNLPKDIFGSLEKIIKILIKTNERD